MQIEGILLTVALVQIACAFISGAMALGRDRDGAIWFLVGSVFGPISVLALIVFGKPPQPR